MAVHLREHVIVNGLVNLNQYAYQTGPLNRNNILIKNVINLSLSKDVPTAFLLLSLSVALASIHHGTLFSTLSSCFGVC